MARGGVHMCGVCVMCVCVCACARVCARAHVHGGGNEVEGQSELASK